jgi:inosine-uridine nucleoside N-ribohydrolase
MLLDTDGGVDDLLALFMLSRMVPSSAPLDISVTFGNVPLDRAVANVSTLVGLGGIAVGTVLRGSVAPVRGSSEFAFDVHGSDGIGGMSRKPEWSMPLLPTKDLRKALDSSQYDKIVAVGPLSNMALLARAREQSSPPLYVMGGAFDTAGNVTPAAEFNFYSDPDAAHEVFSRYPNDIWVISLDLCKKVVLTRSHLSRLCKLNPGRTAAFLEAIHQGYMNFYRRTEGIDGCYPHDTICAFAAMVPDAFSWTRGRVSIALEGPERGRSRFVADDRGSHLLAKDIDVNGFFAALDEAMLGPRLGTLASGEAVYTSLEGHAREYRRIEPYLQAALARIDAEGRDIFHEQVELATIPHRPRRSEAGGGATQHYARRNGRGVAATPPQKRALDSDSFIDIALKRTPAGYILGKSV